MGLALGAEQGLSVEAAGEGGWNVARLCERYGFTFYSFTHTIIKQVLFIPGRSAVSPCINTVCGTRFFSKGARFAGTAVRAR